jgi:hypothetical protein
MYRLPHCQEIVVPEAKNTHRKPSHLMTVGNGR